MPTCARCAILHCKCETAPGDSRCKRCKQDQEVCDTQRRFRFRPVKSVYTTRSDGTIEKRDVHYASDQVWVPTKRRLSFVDFFETEDIEIESPSNTFDNITADSGPRNFPAHGSKDPESDRRGNAPPVTRYPSEIIAEEQNFDCAPLYTLASAAAASHELPHTNVNYVNSPISHISTTSIHSHRLTPLLQGPPHLSSPVLPISLDSSVTGYNEPDVPHWDSHQPFDVRGERRHAMLLRHYIDSLAPEFDTCDIFSHFEFEVPRRARISRTLFYAILALAAKHESVMFNRTDGEAATYYVRCLDLLIPCLDPGNPIDETLFVTIILLRLYEERADVDEHHHLFAATGLLNTTTFASCGGLAEAASWIALRQHIFPSLTLRQPLQINLDNYLASSVFTDDSDTSWTNRIVFLVAKVLSATFQQSPELSCEQWDSLCAEVEEWNDNKPAHLSPLWPPDCTLPEVQTSQPNHTTSQQHEEHTNYPEIIMANAVHVVGRQHYTLAKMLLISHNPRLPRFGIDAIRLHREADKQALRLLRIIVGLAISNPSCLNAGFTASHVLCACGSWLISERDREGAIEFLLGMETRVGWRTEAIRTMLGEQWAAT